MATFSKQSLGNFPSLPNFEENNKPKKFLQQQITILAVQRSVKYFFWPEFPQYCKNLWQKKKKLAIPRHFHLQASVSVFIIFKIEVLDILRGLIYFQKHNEKMKSKKLFIYCNEDDKDDDRLSQVGRKYKSDCKSQYTLDILMEYASKLRLNDLV